MNRIAHRRRSDQTPDSLPIQLRSRIRKLLIANSLPHAAHVIRLQLSALLFAGRSSLVNNAQEMINLIQKPRYHTHPMILFEFVQTRHVSASIRLTETTALQVNQYAAFIKASSDDVVEQSLAYVFSKDRDFQEFLKSAEAQQITPTLRVHRAPRTDTAEQPPKKPANGVANGSTSTAFVAGSRA